jgi:hypothetical protein
MTTTQANTEMPWAYNRPEQTGTDWSYLLQQVLDYLARFLSF